MYIYFVRQTNGGPIKVGAGSEPRNRLRTLQVGNPDKLEMIGLCRGTLAGERMLRTLFDDDSKLHPGEWITATPDLLRFIGRLPTLEQWEAGASCPEIIAPADRYQILRRAGFTLQEIGDHHGVSRQHVHQVAGGHNLRRKFPSFRERKPEETISDYMAEIGPQLAQNDMLAAEGDL